MCHLQVLGIVHLQYGLGRIFRLFLRQRRVLLFNPDLDLVLASVPTFQERLPPGAKGIPGEICLDGGNI